MEFTTNEMFRGLEAFQINKKTECLKYKLKSVKPNHLSVSTVYRTLYI
jgi:hypothetical protein